LSSPAAPIVVQHGENVAGFGIFTQLPLEHASLSFRAIGVAGMLVLRRAGFGKELDGFTALVHEQGPVWERGRALLTALEEEIPELGAALAIDARQLREAGAFERHRAHLEELAQQHAGELDALWARRPDLRP